MGQTNLERTYFIPREEITTSGDLVRHEMAFTGYYNIGDTIQVLDIGPNGRIISTLGTATVVAIEKDTALVLDSSIDTSLATGTPYAQVKDIDDGQSAVDRLYRRVNSGSECEIIEPITGQSLDTPVVGQATYTVADVGYFKAGQSIQILHDSGTAGSADIVSVSENADESNNQGTIVINSSIDTSALTNPKFQVLIPVCTLIDSIKQDIDLIDRPIENEDLDTPDCSNTAFETDNLFAQGTTHLYIDGRKLRLGTAGTRAATSQGSSNSELTFTSLILGTAGNKTKVSVTNAAGTAITVSGDFNSGYTIDAANNSGAATAAQIAAAINADSEARRLIQAQYGGDGSGAVTAFAATNLTGGLDDGSGDYAEIPQVINNEISATGYKFVSLWILPDDRNRLNKPPRNTEEMYIDYRQILYNA